MKHLALAIFVLAACTDETDTKPHDIGKTVVEMCGEPPNSPGWTVSVNGGTATMDTAVYNQIVAWRDAMATWRDCTVGIP